MKSKLSTFIIFFLSTLVILVVWGFTSSGLKPVNGPGDSEAPEKSTIKPAAEDAVMEHQSENGSTRWYFPEDRQKPKGVALVIHGLNLRPEKMIPIISKLTESGIDVLNLSLRGHGENYTHRDGIDSDTARMEAFKAVTYQLWINEAYLAYAQTKQRTDRKKVPLFLIGFSFGGLIGLDLFTSYPDVNFDRMILFAPPIKLHATIYLQRVLSPFPRLVIPSLASESYLSNKKGTPVAAYNALFEGLDHFMENTNSKINVPTLIFIDAQDEFIPLRRLKKLVEEKKLDQWKFYIVQKGKEVKHGTFHHHIIDEYSTGKNVWKDMMRTATEHLFEKS